MNYTITGDYQHARLPKDYEKIILVTMHRRENIGEPMRNVFRGLAKIAENFLMCRSFSLCIRILKYAYQLKKS